MELGLCYSLCLIYFSRAGYVCANSSLRGIRYDQVDGYSFSRWRPKRPFSNLGQEGVALAHYLDRMHRREDPYAFDAGIFRPKRCESAEIADSEWRYLPSLSLKLILEGQRTLG